VAAGVALVASPEAINRFVVSLTRRVLSEDPDDAIVTYLRHVGHGADRLHTSRPHSAHQSDLGHLPAENTG
jgi:uncharacterized membrane protein